MRQLQDKDVAQRRGQFAQSLLFVWAGVMALWLGACAALAAPPAAIVVDARTGQVLFEQNADSRLHPASLTKMLTLYIAFDAVKRREIGLDTMVTVSAKAAAEPPSRLGLRQGQRISLRHLIRAAALKSGNDAATAIAEAISGSESAFAQRMNRTAKALGMTRSTFRNAHGLTAEGHLSTARDMNLLGRRLFYDFPEFYPLFSRRSEDAGMARVTNTNSRFLENYEGADGIKTGYTNAAGFNLTASAERGNKRIIATVFGGKSTVQRNARMTELMNMGFGSAPARAKTVPPKSVALTAMAQPVSDPLADAVASAAASAVAAAIAAQPASQAGANAGAAKTIRVSFAMTTSPRPPRPPRRPDGQSVAELQGNVADVLAGLTETQDTAPVTRSEAVPFEIVQAEPVQQAVVDSPALVAAVPAVTPPPRPADLVQAVPTEDPAQDPMPQIAEVVPETAPAEVAAVVPPVALPEVQPQQVQQVAGAAIPNGVTTRPEPRSGEIVMTAARKTAAPEATQAEPAGEVVTRVSTSGGRHWAVNIGQFPNRGAAERALLQTALSETRTLSGALRKVSQSGGSWAANFAGLTQEQADLACRRLQARAVTCFTLGP